MEYADGGSLRDYLNKNFKRLSWNINSIYLSISLFQKLFTETWIDSIGVLLWEISSGKPPFHEEINKIGLIYNISQGRREEIIPDTPSDYSTLYTECWNNEPSKRPTVHEVVNRLKMLFISKFQNSNYNNINTSERDWIITKEQINQNIPFEKNFNIMINE
ncbi:kinase-like domain-containing protein [Rhizophagus irregularis DAOM 181602=DAOM 197198]|nr:kinase-like domain-containing protein [Rhizophagus irregularis DAOM 181602=DAOM 197198]